MSQGTPMNWRSGCCRISSLVQIADAVTPADMIRSPSPASLISPVVLRRLAYSDSAPSSTATPATSETDSFPPIRDDPSKSVTRTGSFRR